MNQILNNFNSKKNIKSAIGIIPVTSNIKNNPQNYNNNNMKNSDNTFTLNCHKISRYKIQFLISIIVLFIAISLLISNIYSYIQKENVSKNLLNAISITRLYSNNNDYTTLDMKESQNSNALNSNNTTKTNINNTGDPFVIGIIQIDKINVNYPILSKTTRELLKVSLCRYAGPMPNQVGNLCIAGHNLVDYKLFSRLNEIKLKDIIKIYELDEKTVQDKIDNEIKTEEKKAEDLKALGYNVFTRDTKSDMYKIKNATEFFVHNNNLYIIYAYGNDKLTSERDIVVM